MADAPVPALVADLDAPDAAARSRAARRLATRALDDPASVEPALPALVERLRDSEPEVRHRAAQALAKAAAGGVQVPVAPAVDALADDYDPVRGNAARTLAALADHHPETVEAERAALLPALVDPDARVREFAWRTVGQMATARPAWRDPPPRTADGVASDGERARARWRAAAALALARDPLRQLALAAGGEEAEEAVDRLCRAVERAVLRG